MMKRIGELKAENANLKSTADQSKAEVERLKSLTAEMDKTINISQAGCRQLKAEVERLEKLENYLQNTLNQYALDDMRLQAQVERLTKAGNAMASSIQFNEEMAKDYNGPTIVHKSVQVWQAAKEGETK